MQRTHPLFARGALQNYSFTLKTKILALDKQKTTKSLLLGMGYFLVSLYLEYSSVPRLRNNFGYQDVEHETIDHFTVVCSVTWPLYRSEARVDLVLIQTSLLLLCKTSCSDANQVHLHDKSSEVCIKTRSTLASLSQKGQVTEQTTVKWSITIRA